MNTTRLRARITAIVAEIEETQRQLGERVVHDPGDREAVEIIERIERALRKRRRKPLKSGQNVSD